MIGRAAKAIFIVCVIIFLLQSAYIAMNYSEGLDIAWDGAKVAALYFGGIGGGLFALAFLFAKRSGMRTDDGPATPFLLFADVVLLFVVMWFFFVITHA
jgi:hypothetical protein